MRDLYNLPENETNGVDIFQLRSELEDLFGEYQADRFFQQMFQACNDHPEWDLRTICENVVLKGAQE